MMMTRNKMKSNMKQADDRSIIIHQLPVQVQPVADDPCACQVCGKRFASRKAWGGHKKAHNDNKKKKKSSNNNNKKLTAAVAERICCYICSKELKSVRSLGGHMRCHPERTLRGIRAPPLPMVVWQGGDISTMGGREDYSANKTKQASCLDDQTETGGVRKQYQCNMCGRWFPSGQALGGHKRTHALLHLERFDLNKLPTDDV